MSEASVLVVDDDDNNRYTLVERLRRDGFARIAVAGDGLEALAKLAESPIFLVLLDVMMPRLDGIDCLSRIKADANLRHIPVIMMSAASDIDRVVRCIELGAEDYLPKPFNKVLLRARVRASLERKALRDLERAHLAEIDRQRARMSELLHAVLPASAVAELEATGQIEPRRHADVAVLFCDIVGFTAYCDSHRPEDVLADLQALAEAFEAIVARHGLEKIKTIGDAFLATGGLLLAHPDPVGAALDCAFDLMTVAGGGRARWELRCGLHIGPVVAGVVGRSKFSFDLWGDTVNVAARLVGAADPGRVYLSEAAWDHVAPHREGQGLGLVPIRGKGPMRVFCCSAPPAAGNEGHAGRDGLDRGAASSPTEAAT